MNQIMRLKGLNLEDLLSSVEKNPYGSSECISEGSAVESVRTELQSFVLDRLDHSRIYSLESIRKICVDYRLRFLDLNYFRGEIPSEATDEIRRLEKEHGTSLDQFMIMAPSKMFKLEDKDDPLLFVPIGNNYYYLVHKWGTELHPLRKWLVWPFKTLPNLMVLIVMLSILLTMFSPSGMYGNEFGAAEKLVLFLFIFKSVIGVFIYFGFASGKNFSEVIWNSKYYNA